MFLRSKSKRKCVGFIQRNKLNINGESLHITTNFDTMQVYIFILIRLISAWRNTTLKDEGSQVRDIAHFVHVKHINESISRGPPWIPTLPTRFSYKTRPSHAPSISHRTIPSRFHTRTNH